MAEQLRGGLQNLLDGCNSHTCLHFLIMKSVVVCGSKKYAPEIAAFCVELEKLGVLVFEPSFEEVIAESATFHSDYVTKKIFKGLS